MRDRHAATAATTRHPASFSVSQYLRPCPPRFQQQSELKSETLSLYQADMVKYVTLFEEKEKVRSPWHRHHHLTPAHKLKSPPAPIGGPA